ncbi:cytochrome C [Sulfurimonas sp.]|uniref:cytochrome C n=1 Tax=Sulfurimonas sp. TaxID=2022749 RepID=UPI0035679E57
MKKIYLILVLITSIYAEAYTKQNRIDDMQKMAEAMSLIETGFFYNNKDIVRDGALKLSKAVVRVKPPLTKEESKEPLAKRVKLKIDLSNDIVSKIDEKAKTIYNRFDAKDARSSIQAYTSIVKQCMKCHYEIRHW